MWVINDNDNEPVKIKQSDEEPKTFEFWSAAETVRRGWVSRGIISPNSKVVEYNE